MCSTVEQLRESAERLAARLDPDVIHPKDAVLLLEECSRLKKIASAMETLVSGRVASSGNWQKEGDNSAAHFVCRTTGETVKGAVDLINTAQALRELPATDQAFRSGKLTGAQVTEITSLGPAAPKAEKELIKVAETNGLVGLKEAARRIEAAACKDHEEKARRLQSQRFLRTWVDQGGAFKLMAQLTPEAGAEVKAVIDAIRKSLKKKSSDSEDALGADALLEMARSASSGNEGQRVKAEVKIRVDLGAIRRGYPKEGEICDVEGVGPIGVPGLGQFLTSAVYRMVGLEGSDVTKVDLAGRYVPKTVRLAVREKFTKCVIHGCNKTRDLQLDHTVALSQKGRTRVDNLKPFCVKHHRKKHGSYLLIEQDTDPVSYKLAKIEQSTRWDELKVGDRSPP